MGVENTICSTSPAKKRARLSLKKCSQAAKNDSTTGETENTNSVEELKPAGEEGAGENGAVQSEEALTGGEKAAGDSEEQQAAPAQEPQLQEEKMPCVAALENLGNTCYLNSVLQVLRYTPGFTDSVSQLSKDIHNFIRRCQYNKSPDKELSLSWKFVRSLDKLFLRMNKIEEQYREGTSSLVGVRPNRLMSIICDLNPMFEGNLQHDAQELLHCVLCYLEDAWQEFTKTRDLSSPTSDKKKPNPGKQVNGCEVKEENRNGTLNDGTSRTNRGETTPSKMQNSKLGPNGSPHVKNLSVDEVLTIVNGYSNLDNATEVKVTQVTPTKMAEKENLLGRKRAPPSPLSKTLTAHDVVESVLTEDKDGEADGKINGKATTARKNKPIRKGGKKRSSNEMNDLEESEAGGDSKENVKEGKKSIHNQPNILSMFNKASSVKRLGMTRRLVRTTPIKSEPITNGYGPITNGTGEAKLSEATLHINGDESKENLKTEIKIERSEDISMKIENSQYDSNTKDEKPFNQRNGHVYPTTPVKTLKEMKTDALENRAFIKLEKCDSPKYFPIFGGGDGKRVVVPCLLNQMKGSEDVAHKMFQGQMALRTRCEECECFTERKEDFQDVSVPVKREAKDDDSDEEEEDPYEWLMAAFSESERLDGDNKYYCEKCFRYTEAVRSLHYDDLPPMLTLHLKRFASMSGMFGGVSKLSDYVPTPMVLPCLRSKCASPCQIQCHKYSLYAVVMHSGISISSGHYTAYVKALPNTPKPKNPKPSERQSSTPSSRTPGSRRSPDTPPAGLDTPPATAAVAIKTETPEQNGSIENKDDDDDKEEDDDDLTGMWLECDDDCVRVLDEEDFLKTLSQENFTSATPYLLFYRRMQTDV